jgi:hypothetical protein
MLYPGIGCEGAKDSDNGIEIKAEDLVSQVQVGAEVFSLYFTRRIGDPEKDQIWRLGLNGTF